MPRHDVELVPSAVEDLRYYRVYEQRLIVKAILTYLQEEPNTPTRRRKPLRESRLAPWELRIGKYRVFYETLRDETVKILAIGDKVHNELVIRGKKVEL